MEAEAKLSPALLERWRRDAEMRMLTNDELVQHLWQIANDGQTQLYFVLDAQVEWNTEMPKWHDIALGDISPDNCDPPGSGPKRLLPERWRAHGCRIVTEPLSRTNAARSKELILTAIRKAQVLADVFSLVSLQPVRLRAAYRVDASWDESTNAFPRTPAKVHTHFLFPYETTNERTGTVITDDWVGAHLRPFVHTLMSITDNDVRWTLEHAINWHAQANQLQGLGRYIHYWASIELLGSFFYEYLEPTFIGRLSNADLELRVVRRLLDLNSKNYRQIVLDCNRLLSPTAREKMLSLSKVILPRDSDIRHTLFGKDRVEKCHPLEGSRSMYDIRNDIAHGNVSELLREYVDQHTARLERFERVSFKFIIATLKSAHRLCQHRNPEFRPGAVEPSDDA